MRALCNIFPVIPVNNLFNRGRSNAVHLAKHWAIVLTRFPQTPYLSNLIHSQFGSRPTSQVLRQRNWFQVVGIDTSTIPAQVVKLQPFRDWALVSFVVGTMCTAWTVLATPNAIPAWISSTVPVPAPGLRINGIAARIEAVFSTLMSGNIPHRLASDNTSGRNRLKRNRRLAATSTQTQARWIWLRNAFPNTCGLEAFAPRSCAFSATRPIPVTPSIDPRTCVERRDRQFAVTTRAVFARLGVRHVDSPTQDRGVAMPRAVSAAPGPFACFSYPHYTRKPHGFGVFRPVIGVPL